MGVAKRITFNKDPEKFIERAIVNFVQKSPSNRRKVDGGKYWEISLVGFASGEDPLLRNIKRL